MKKLYFYIPLVLCLIFLTSVVFAQENINIDFSRIGPWIADFLCVPKNFMTTKMILRHVMLPFLAVFVAVLGIMRDIMLFRRSRHLDWILALIITFIVLPWTGLMHWLILTLYGLGGVLSALAVGFLICAGAVMWAWGGFRRLKFNEIDLVKGQVERLDQLRETAKNLRVQINTEMEKRRPNWNKVEKWRKQEATIYGEIKDREHHLA